jgi:hypothetical protein
MGLISENRSIQVRTAGVAAHCFSENALDSNAEKTYGPDEKKRTRLNPMTIAIPSDCRKFRAAIPPMFFCTIVASLPGFLCVVLILSRVSFDRRGILSGSASIPVTSFLLTSLLSIYYRAGISAEGIYGHSVWGTRRFIAWQEIAGARTFRLLNLRWLRIYGRDGKVTWLALFQSRPAEFEREIRRLAPDGSPVLRFL